MSLETKFSCMGNCITAPFRGNCRNCSGARAAGRGAAGGGRAAGRVRRRWRRGCRRGAGWRGCGTGSGGARWRVRTASPGRRVAWARVWRGVMAGSRTDRGAGAAQAARRRRCNRRLALRDSGERDQNRRGALMRRASQVWTIGRKARSTKLQAAATKRPNSAGNIYAPCMSSAGNIFTPCMISGPSARKTALDGKIPAPCIQNHPIAPGNGHMGRRCCHFYPKKHAWGENVASKGAYCAHSAKRERIRRDSCQMGPGPPQCKEGVRGLWGGAVGDAAGASNTAGSGADGMGMAGAMGRRRDTCGCGAGTTLAGMAVWGRGAGGIGGDRKLARRRLGASLAALAG